MIKTGQLLMGEKVGDCFRACLCSILEIPNDLSLPNVDDKMWLFKWNDFLQDYGLEVEWDKDRIWRSGYWIASVPTKNLSKGTTHAIVMKGSAVAFDPSPKKKYRIGRNMLGSKKVHSGFYLVVNDPSRLRKIEPTPPKKPKTEVEE